jgi:hypothetical protein
MRRIIHVLLLCTWLTLVMLSSATAQQWRAIVPLRSTRTDVEKLLGPSEGKTLGVYQLENEVVSIGFSEGPCDEKNHQGWNVPRDTVIEMTVSPRAAILFADLPINKAALKKKPDPHLADITYYVNEDEGITYQVSAAGTLTYTSYGPKARDESLRCRALTVSGGQNCRRRTKMRLGVRSTRKALRS